tara:strand:- start:306 stop:686 length:381 start_codon:yes stop_codon:yes gene_type:complete
VSLSVKRKVNVQVKITESFKKKYILLMNTLIDEIKKQIQSYKVAARSLKDDLVFRPFVANKMNESLMKKSQLEQQIKAIKACKNGDMFNVSTLDGHVELKVGDDILQAISPVTVQVDESKITDIQI